MYQRLLGLIALVLTLAACGGGAAQAPTATRAPTPAPAEPTSAPAEPTSAPAPTAAQAATALAEPTQAPATQADASPFSGIASGKTPEGYNYLGDPKAPIELVMYSDYF
jgi:hypothetical protein